MTADRPLEFFCCRAIHVWWSVSHAIAVALECTVWGQIVTYVHRIATTVAIATLVTLGGVAQAQAQALFRLFFAHEQHDLTPDSADMVRQIVAYAGGANFRIATIDIVGHADTSEPDPDGLSTSRAQAVAAALRSGGLSPSTGLTVRGAGISEPYVPTADGVAEPLNRFVSVVIN